jgi:peroxiredoxin Q/BCP
LVQLQADLTRIEAAGLQVVGISYDSAGALKKFTDSKKIAFPLLSDTGSRTIKAYGILNPKTQVLPYPGTFILDQSGVVRAKLFHEGYRERHSTEELLQAARAVP